MAEERWSVVLAGGVGSRFWPLSTPARPKQLLPLVDEQPLLLNTLDRLSTLTPRERTLVLTNASLVPAIAAAIPDLPPGNIIAEPRPAGTAAALTYAAACIERRGGSDAVMLCVHADWSIADPDGFRAALQHAADVAEQEHGLVTVGIVPTRPDPGFGYIEPAAEAGHGVRRVARFVEKPTRERAAEMCRDGYLWNSGIFVWRVGDFLDEVRAHTPEVAPALKTLTNQSDSSGIDAFFAMARSVSVDVGVLERSSRLFVIPGDFGWDDVGTWAALRRVRPTDAAGNVTSGQVHAVDAQRNVVHAEGNTVVLYGVSDLVVVTRDGLTVVTTVDKSADLKTLVEALPDSLQHLA
ncbi:MAG TPA: sugar phosphate nucleotidyltransferase [Gemmatimonadaceae bacterium]|nr:sugar phosphate nucleotidyltransferase [Gemmatimonadaceae bacterium]